MVKRVPKFAAIKPGCLFVLLTVFVGLLPALSLSAQSPGFDVAVNAHDFVEKIKELSKNGESGSKISEIKKLCDSLSGSPNAADLRLQIITKLISLAEQQDDVSLSQAEIYWDAAETLAQQEADNFRLATAISIRANKLNELEQYQAALANYRRSIELLSVVNDNDLKKKKLLCRTLAAAGEVADYLDETESAQNFFDDGWRTLNELPNWRADAELTETAKTILIGQGELARGGGDSAQAKQKFVEALALNKNNDFETAEILWSIGKLEREAGEYAASAAKFTKALNVLGEIAASGDTDKAALKANLLNSYGLLLLEQRSAATATEKLNEALLIFRRINDKRLEAAVLRNLSIAARQTGDLVTAQKRAENALRIAAEINSDDLYVSANNILAGLLQSKEKHLEAAAALRKSIVRAESSQNSLRLAEAKWRLGESLFALKNYKEAEALANECLEISRERSWSNLIYLSATLAGRTLAAEGETTAARKMFESAVQEIEEKRFAVDGAEIEKISFMNDKTTAYHELLKLHAAAGEIEQALEVSEKLKSRVLAEKFKVAVVPPTPPGFPANQTPTIPSGTALISFALTSDKCFAFVLRAHEKPKLIALDATEPALREKTILWRKSLADFDPEFKAQAKELYELLLGNLGNEPGETKNLLIVPDGVLWELPFQALINDSKQYLIEKFGIAYAPSLAIHREMQRLPRRAQTANNRILAFGNSTIRSAAPLIEAEREVNEIKKFYEQPKIFVTSAATEARFKQNAAEAQIIQLALHGVINAENPFDSALLFAPGAGEDGRLTVAEIMRLRLPRSLIVLSSCDTSNGRVLSGEGLLSLAWAFLAANSRGVVAAQWAVEERSTADLMIDFHRALTSNPKNAALALQAAQNKAIKRPPPFNHPNYWSAFVVIGESD